MVDIVQKGTYPVTGLPRFVDADRTRPTHIRVRATTEGIKRRMRHGVTRVGFIEDIGHSIEWPFDQFTKRRIRDGDVIIDESGPGGAEAAAIFPRAKEAQEKTRARLEAKSEQRNRERQSTEQSNGQPYEQPVEQRVEQQRAEQSAEPKANMRRMPREQPPEQKA
jgi:hypothetical protein